jgi:hypothetical protein
MYRQMARLILGAGVVAALVACGGGGSDAAAPPTTGAAGETTVGPDGSSVQVPADALRTPVTVRIAKDSTDAPALPAGPIASDVYAITPHGTQFAHPATVRLPYNAQRLPSGATPVIAKAEALNGPWRLLETTVNGDGTVSAPVNGLSWFVVIAKPVLVTGPLTPVTPSLTWRPWSSDGVDDWVGPNIMAGNPIVTKTVLRPANQFVDIALNNAPVCNTGWRTTVEWSRRYRASDPLGTHVDDARARAEGYSRSTYAVAANGVIRVDIPWTLLEEVNDQTGFWRPSSPSDVWIAREVFYDVLVDHPYCQDSAFTYFPTPEGIQYRRLQITVKAGTRKITISRHPSNLTVAAGQTATFATDVLNSGPARDDNRVRVDWLRAAPGSSLFVAIGSTFSVDTTGITHTLTQSAVRAADNGARYRAVACVIDNTSLPSDCAETAAATLTATQSAELPVFTRMPASLLVRTGQTASLSALATGVPAPTLRWQRRDANSTGPWVDVSTGSGATTANYTTAPLAIGDNGMQLRVVATNAAGTTESNAATVSVSDVDVAPTIVAQPAALAVTAGSEALFAVVARGTEALSYQWRRNGVPILGANSALLKLPAVTAGDAGAYSIEVSNGFGNAVSADALLTVAAGGAVPPSAPSIATQPAAVSVNAGNTATFAVGVGGSAPLVFQWRKDGVDIAGATAAAHTIAAAVPADVGSYSVRVSNGAGALISSAASLSVTPEPAVQAPVIAAQPAPAVVLPGAAATLAVAVSGSAPLAYQWTRDGTPIAGATGPVLALSGVSTLNAGSYSVSVSNSAGSVTSAAAQLIVVGAPAITTQPVAATAAVGATATFSVSASGDALRYQWTRNQVAISGATAASHTTPALTLADNGALYGVVVYNGAGVVLSQGAPLSVTATPQWQAAAPIETDDNGNAQGPSLAVNAAGEAVAVWMQPGGGVGINIWANRYTPAGGWGAAQRISDGSGDAQGAQAVALDANGNAIAVWQQSDSIWANRYTAGSGWGTPELIETGNGWAYSPQVGVDASGNAIAVWAQQVGARSSVVANRYVAGSGWGTPVTIEADDSGDVSAPQIAVDAAGNAVVVWAWAADSGGSNFVYSVWANRYVPGAGWSVAAPIDSNNTEQPNPAPQVALDATGNAIAVWHRRDSGTDSVASNRYTAGAGWGSAAFLETDAAIISRNARIAADAAGNAITVWEQYAGATANVMASRYSAGSGWGTPVLIETNDAGSAFTPQIVIDADGNATALWSQRDAAAFTFNIWTNRYVPGSGWGSAVAIDGQVEPAQAPALGVDASGRVVAVWEQTVGALTHLWASGWR